jgi:hypothetical protein
MPERVRISNAKPKSDHIGVWDHRAEHSDEERPFWQTARTERKPQSER